MSGEVIATCCGRSGRLFRAHKSTKPAGPQTFYSHRKCYARATRDCSDKISGEHYFSHTILEEMSPLDVIKGFTWPTGKSAAISSKSPTANVLCTRHNSALSPLDDRAGQFYRELVDAENFLRNDEQNVECAYLAAMT